MQSIFREAASLLHFHPARLFFYIKEREITHVSTVPPRTRDTSSRFIGFLTYKAALAGKKVITIDEQATTKTCCVCGAVHDMPLWKRVMDCECGNRIDRDQNSAVNIMVRFLSQDALWTGYRQFADDLRQKRSDDLRQKRSEDPGDPRTLAGSPLRKAGGSSLISNLRSYDYVSKCGNGLFDILNGYFFSIKVKFYFA